MKSFKHHLLLGASALLSASMLLGTFGCSMFSGSDSSAGSSDGASAAAVGSVAGSAAVGAVGSAAMGSAVPTGGLEENVEIEPEEEANPIPEGDKYIAITFDDGPTGNDDGLTERLLDALQERGVHATFFLCGYRIKDFNSMMDRYLEEGHEVGNHTMDHLLLTSQVDDGGYEQVKSNNKLIKEYTGQKPTVMRPTGGAYDDQVKKKMKKLGLPMILWSVDTLDWKYRDADSVRDRILEGAEDGAIVLEHDLYETTVEGVLEAIDELQEDGYAFVTVSELAQVKGVTLKPGKVYSDFTDETVEAELKKAEAKKAKKEKQNETKEDDSAGASISASQANEDDDAWADAAEG